MSRAQSTASAAHRGRLSRRTRGADLGAGGHLGGNAVSHTGPPDVEGRAQHTVARHSAHAGSADRNSAAGRHAARHLPRGLAGSAPSGGTSGSTRTPIGRRTATMTFIPSRKLAALVTTCRPGRARAQRRQGLDAITVQAGDSAKAPQPGCSTAHLDSAAACVDGDHAQAVCAGVRLHREHLRNQQFGLRAQAEHLL